MSMPSFSCTAGTNATYTWLKKELQVTIQFSAHSMWRMKKYWRVPWFWEASPPMDDRKQVSCWSAARELIPAWSLWYRRIRWLSRNKHGRSIDPRGIESLLKQPQLSHRSWSKRGWYALGPMLVFSSWESFKRPCSSLWANITTPKLFSKPFFLLSTPMLLCFISMITEPEPAPLPAY